MKKQALDLGGLLTLVLSSLLLVACARTVPPARPLAATTPTSTPTTASTATPWPTSTPLPTPMPTATPTPQLTQLTTGGCCVNPGWSPDSRQVLFIDKPSENDLVGIYAVDIFTGAKKSPQWSGRVGIYSPDRSLIEYTANFETVIEKLDTGEKWAIPGQVPVDFAPDNQHVAWDNDVDTTGPYDQRPSDLYVADVNTRKPVRITRVYGGGLIGWLPSGLKLMYQGRPSLDVRERTLTVLDLTTNVTTTLVSAERLAGMSVSKDGTWLAYYITFDADKSRNGLWVQRTDGSQRRKLDMWGAYQWRDDSRLLVIPMRASSDTAFEVWEVDAASGRQRKLTDAATTPLQILNGDWRVSPDGRYVVYVNSVDRNLWLLTLPAVGGQ
jgi:Tol biopolymer transport system component